VELQEVMRSFAATLSQWRQTHYSLAVRMLGQLGGTGYTEGTPYLDRARTIPVFHGAGDGEVKRS
jgi:tryptophan 2,3-dioxygenase